MRHTTTCTLPDGRVISCITEFNAMGVWQEFSDGLYKDAVSRLKPGDTVLDVGAHIGLTTLLINDSVPDLQMIACEPAPPTFSCLQQNFNTHLPSGTAVNAAVGSATGTTTLTFYPHSDVMSTTRIDEADDRRNMQAALANHGVHDPVKREFFIHRAHSEAEEFTVDVVTLSQIFAEHDVTDVGLLKIDVERAELEVLRGLTDENWMGIRNIIAEVHEIDGQLTQFMDLLRAKGFQLEDEQQAIYGHASTHLVTGRRES